MLCSVAAQITIKATQTNRFLVKDFPQGQVIYLYYQDSDALTVTVTFESPTVYFGVQVKGIAKEEEMEIDTDYSAIMSSEV